MSLFEMTNTVTKVSAGPANDVEVIFGLAALKMLEAGAKKSTLQELVKLHASTQENLAALDEMLADIED